MGGCYSDNDLISCQISEIHMINMLQNCVWNINYVKHEDNIANIRSLYMRIVCKTIALKCANLILSIQVKTHLRTQQKTKQMVFIYFFHSKLHSRVVFLYQIQYQLEKQH